MQRFWEFVGGDQGQWRVTQACAVSGTPLEAVNAVRCAPLSYGRDSAASMWTLHGVRSNERYTSLDERNALAGTQAGLGRPEATSAALIPIRKSAAWWALAQDERRAIMEEQSHHIAIGAKYLPAVARRLYHCRDLVGVADQPFDFLTWFEFSPDAVGAFDELLGRLRESVEWQFVDREVELRLDWGDRANERDMYV